MQQRQLGKLFGLSIITLGIYQIYWLVQTRRELIRQTAIDIPPVWALFLAPAILFGSSALGVSLSGIKGIDGAGLPTHFLSTISIAAFFATIVIPFLWLWRYGHAVAQVTGGETSPRFVLAIALLAPNIWIFVMQHEFNIVVNNAIAASTHPKKSKKAPRS